LLFKHVDFAFRHDHDYGVCRLAISKADGLDEVVAASTICSRGDRDASALFASVASPEANAVVNGARDHLVLRGHIQRNDIANVGARLSVGLDGLYPIGDAGLRDEGDETFPAGDTCALFRALLEEQDVRDLVLQLEVVLYTLVVDYGARVDVVNLQVASF